MLLAGMDLPQLGQVIVFCAGGVRLVPQLGQNLLVAGTFFAAFGADDERRCWGCLWCTLLVHDLWDEYHACAECS